MSTQPTTAAGRALRDKLLNGFVHEADDTEPLDMSDAILAIEAEARQQDGSALPSIETLTAWLREDYAAEAATSGGNPFATRRPEEFVASRIRSRLGNEARQ